MNRNRIRGMLPELFRRTDHPGSPLAASLEVMARLHEPSEEILARLEEHFDPRRCPDEFVSLLASWVDLAWLVDRRDDADGHEPLRTGVGRLRELVAGASGIASGRGTRDGLLRFLRLATGEPGFSVEEPGDGSAVPARPFHITVLAPASTRQHRALIESIVEREKPAYVTYDLVFTAPPPGDAE